MVSALLLVLTLAVARVTANIPDQCGGIDFALPELLPSRDNSQGDQVFSLTVQDAEDESQTTYRAGKMLKVSLNPPGPVVGVLLVAHSEAAGAWQRVSVPWFSEACADGSSALRVNMGSAGMTMVPPFMYTTAPHGAQPRFEAVVITASEVVYNIVAKPLVEVPNVHEDPREYEEKPASTDEETSEKVNEENLEPDTDPSEDPNEGERWDEQQRKEEEFRDTHGLEEEEESRLRAAQRQQELLKLELEESEGEWRRVQIREAEEREEQRHQEMMEYERVMAEEEKRRIEMIQWEIRDKEEHDMQMMREKEKNETPKDEVEINVEEEVLVVEDPVRHTDSGASAATVGTTFVLVFTAFTALFM